MVAIGVNDDGHREVIGAAAMLKAIHAMESRDAAETKAPAVAGELDRMSPGKAARVVRDGHAETLAYTGFPRERWRRMRTNNAIERPNREIRGRTRVVGTFPDSKTALTLSPRGSSTSRRANEDRGATWT